MVMHVWSVIFLQTMQDQAIGEIGSMIVTNPNRPWGITIGILVYDQSLQWFF